MHDKTCSGATLKAWEVLRLCALERDSILLYREKKFEAMLARRMAPRKLLFGLINYSLTREQAIVENREDIYSGTYPEQIRLSAWNVINRLEKQAKHVHNLDKFAEMYITAGDFAVFGWKDPYETT